MVDREEVLERVREAVSEVTVFGLAEVKPDSRLLEDLNADSLQLMELIEAFQEEFDVELDEEAAFRAETVQRLADLVAEAIEDGEVQQ